MLQPYCLDDYNPAPVTLAGVTFHLVSNFWHFSVNDTSPPNINDGILDVRLAYSRHGTAGPDALLPFNLTLPAGRGAFIPRGVGARDPVR
jgi:hypothetical protein